jgi:hypothetical protein
MDLFDFTALTSNTSNYNKEILDAVGKVLSGPSAVVYKPTRVGFTYSSEILALAEKRNMLLVAPTNKIGDESVQQVAPGSIKIYGHSACKKLQELTNKDPFMKNLPLHLPKDCPCGKYPDCDYTDSWYGSTKVRTVTTDKIVSLAMSDTNEATLIKEQLGNLHWLIIDESHLLCMDKEVVVDVDHKHIDVPHLIPRARRNRSRFWEFKKLEYVYGQFGELMQEIREMGIIDRIKSDVEQVGTSERHSYEWTNNNAITSECLIACFGDLERLAKNRHELNVQEDDILYLMSACSLMSNTLVHISFLRTSDGDK